jgi:hypothetical protein
MVRPPVLQLALGSWEGLLCDPRLTAYGGSWRTLFVCKVRGMTWCCIQKLCIMAAIDLVLHTKALHYGRYWPGAAYKGWCTDGYYDSSSSARSVE